VHAPKSLNSLRFQRLARNSFAAVCGIAVVVMPIVAGPFGYDSLAVSYVPYGAHRAYGYGLVRDQLAHTIRGRAWIEASEMALVDPISVELPFKEQFASSAQQPQAAGYRFDVQSGRKITAEISIPVGAEGDLFVEFFESQGAAWRHIRSVAGDAARQSDQGRIFRLEWDGFEESQLLLRVQPELVFDGTIEVSVAQSPLLGFPVTDHSIRSIQSAFGAERDGGRRAHRGADIFATRGTNVVASVDAWVSRVETTPVGGNVVWLQPLFGDLRLYYAHLDTQLVSEGAFVFAGETIGTVGNTGNAITTPPHLHYGVYLRRRGIRGGARDPYDFLR
jgi:murein DD-endopeptidase MepM/ murein hydrolase activator NlpD